MVQMEMSAEAEVAGQPVSVRRRRILDVFKQETLCFGGISCFFCSSEDGRNTFGRSLPGAASIRVPADEGRLWCRKSSAVIWIVRQEAPWKKRMSNTDFSVPFFFRPEEKARKSCRPVSSEAAASMSLISGAGEQWL